MVNFPHVQQCENVILNFTVLIRLDEVTHRQKSRIKLGGAYSDALGHIKCAVYHVFVFPEI